VQDGYVHADGAFFSDDDLTAQLASFFSASDVYQPDDVPDEKIQQSLVTPIQTDDSACSGSCCNLGDIRDCTKPTVSTVNVGSIKSEVHSVNGIWSNVRDHFQYYQYAYFALFVLIVAITAAPYALAASFPTVNLPYQNDVCVSGPAALDGLPFSPSVETDQTALSAVADTASPSLARAQPWRVLAAFILLVSTVFVAWPLWGSFVSVQNPIEVATAVTYGLATPFIGFFNNHFTAFNAATGGIPIARAAGALTRLKRMLPMFVTVILMASAAFIGSSVCGDQLGRQTARASAISTFSSSASCILATGSAGPVSVESAPNASHAVAARAIDLEYHGAWMPEWVTDARDLATGAAAVASTIFSQTALLNASAEAKADAISTGLPVFHAHPDSGCTGSCTDDCRRLVNQRPCDEVYGQANGHISACTVIGDMPVYAKESSGEVIAFTFTNVRCVPSFKYTLISVRQIWNEQRIDARFRDLDYLELPNGTATVPYDATAKLYTIVFVSKAMAAAPTSKAPTSACSREQSALVGFHSMTSTSHVERMSAGMAGALYQRRSGLGLVKRRALAHTTADAPKSLSASPPITDVHAAQAEIKAAAHSGSLDTTCAEPGELDFDAKGPFPLSKCGGYRWAAFFIDRHTRFVFVEFCKTKEEFIEATKRVMAKFNAIVGVPIDDQGRPLARPTVRKLHRDREGKFESYAFQSFREEQGLYSTTSPPHDHDLNPVAESIIRVIDVSATRARSQGGVPVGFWPELIRNSVDWHNASVTSVGSSSADPGISAYQRLTGKQPRVADLGTPGARAVVLKPRAHRRKGMLEPPGWVGQLLCRCPDSVGCWEYWIPALGKKVASSSGVIDEEYFPWLGKDAHQPLRAPEARPAAATLGGEGMKNSPLPGLNKAPNTNATPKVELKALNLFSGQIGKKDGLADHLKRLGWSGVYEYDNAVSSGGGWHLDLLNDGVYADLLARAGRGEFAAIMVAFPCSTFSIARFFDAARRFINGAWRAITGGDRGPQPVRTLEHPDGLPVGELDPRHRKELLRTNRLLDRAVAICVAGRNSSANTTVVWENPSDRTISGTPQYMPEFADRHGSLFATSAIRRLREAIPSMSTCTFASCQFGGAYQKYTTLLYTAEAGAVLDPLSGPSFQCNHPPGTHEKIAGGRNDSSAWASEEAAAYPPKLCATIAAALTSARTGSARLVPGGQPSSDGDSKLPSPAPPPGVTPPTDASDLLPTAVGSIPLPNATAQPPPSAVPDAMSPPSSGGPSPVTFQGFDTPASVNLGGGIQGAPRVLPVQGRAERGARAATRTARAGQDNHSWRPRASAVEIPPSIPEELPQVPFTSPSTATGPSPSYVSFSGTPVFPSDAGEMDATVAEIVADAGMMEATVAEIIVDAYGAGPQFQYDPVGPWKSIGLSAVQIASSPDSLQVSEDTWVQEITEDQLTTLLTSGSKPAAQHHALYNMLKALRADSEGAPEKHAEAMARGGPWPAAIQKELDNHFNNSSWATITRSELPKGRKLHKFVWVFKLKRDGTPKARLCVQGCTLQEGVDYDQTFAKTLLLSSARALFAYAARRGCRVRSIDYVAAYLQGEFIDGEVVYCHAPPGSEKIGADGKPLICRVEKPVYGIPQAGRRLQRRIFPWCTNTMGLRQLDESDSCVFVYDDPAGKETFAVGIYVDNLQIVHSAELDEQGEAIDPDSFYAKFVSRLRSDWDVIDEGPMSDLLGVEVDYQQDGSILLHQAKYVKKMIERFYPSGLPTSASKCSLPFTPKLGERIRTALDCRPINGATLRPELITEFQQRIGSLMYACTATRCDIAFPVHQLCQCMTCPTDDLMLELDCVFGYLSKNASLGLRFSPSVSELEGFSDASFEERNSTSGWLVLWQNAPLAWGSRKQKSISLSSCESEIYALSEAAKDMVYFRKLVRGLEPSAPDGPSLLYCDNKAARDLAYNPEHHNKTKHIARRHFFVRDMVEAFELQVPFVATADNIADFFTKALDAKSFFRFRNIIMNVRAS